MHLIKMKRGKCPITAGKGASGRQLKCPTRRQQTLVAKKTKIWLNRRGCSRCIDALN